MEVSLGLKIKELAKFSNKYKSNMIRLQANDKPSKINAIAILYL